MQIKNTGRQYHSSLFKIDGTFNQDLYDSLGKEVKGHVESCAWEGHISTEACGCTKEAKVAPVKGKGKK